MTHDITHDMSDAWYLSEEEKWNQWQIVREFTRVAGCPPNICWQASWLAARLSNTVQMDQGSTVHNSSHGQPIHRILRDAYHLQELGATGVSRSFHFGGIDEVEREIGVDVSIEIFRLVNGRYIKLMMTGTGAKVAEERYKWVVEEFVKKWDEEANTENVSGGEGGDLDESALKER